MKQNIVITGGTSGVGFSIAKDLSIDHNIIIIGRNKTKGELQAEKLGKNVTFIQADLASDISNLVYKINARFKNIDTLLLSSGIMPENKNDNISNNLMSHYNTVNNLLPLLNGGNVLVITGNPHAIDIIPICEQQGNYIERMSWVVTHKTLLMVYLSQILKEYHIRVNSFFPGDVKSDLMPYTQNLSNTRVLMGRNIILDESLKEKNGVFFDQDGSEVTVNKNKYSFNRAEKILTEYLKVDLRQ